MEIYYQPDPGSRGEGRIALVNDEITVPMVWNNGLMGYDAVTHFKPSRGITHGIKLTQEKADILTPISSTEMKSPKKQLSSEEEGSSHGEDRTAGNETSASGSSSHRGQVNYEEVDSKELLEKVNKTRSELVKEAKETFTSYGGVLPEEESSTPTRMASKAAKSSDSTEEKPKRKRRTDAEIDAEMKEKLTESQYRSWRNDRDAKKAKRKLESDKKYIRQTKEAEARRLQQDPTIESYEAVSDPTKL